jgi:hypothetical protein
VDEYVIARHGRGDICVDEFADQIAGRRVVGVRRCDAADLGVLRKKYDLELFVVATRIVT